MLYAGYGRIYEWMSFLGLVFVTIAASLKLDGVVDWPWGLIFIPIYFIILQLFYIPIMYDVSSAAFERVIFHVLTFLTR